ncbi:hypothetical protein OYT88_04540 [Sporolactobacillus sp. CQH2019]|nr:hypothetical protein [Sporolactobacillus sp. CQH2019]MDD9147817.1 hypothetical protein [Sporolactobacillus sp. CQH2019]
MDNKKVSSFREDKDKSISFVDQTKIENSSDKARISANKFIAGYLV